MTSNHSFQQVKQMPSKNIGSKTEATPFCIQYEHKGKSFAATILAVSHADALARCKSMQAGLKVDGKLA